MKIKIFSVLFLFFLAFSFAAVNNAEAQLLTCGGGATESDCVTAGGQVQTVNGCTLCRIPKGSFLNATSACSAAGLIPHSSWTYYSGSSCPSDCSITAGWYNYQPTCTYESSTPSYLNVFKWPEDCGCCPSSGCLSNTCYSCCPSIDPVYYKYNLSYCDTYDQGSWYELAKYICNVYASSCYYLMDASPTVTCAGAVESYGCIGETPNVAPTAAIDLPSATNQTINIGSSVIFSGHGTDSDGGITGYSWRLGSCDGTVLSSSQSFSYNFNTAGSYTVYLVTIDNDGALSTNCPYRTITVVPPSLPVCVECNATNKASVCVGKNFDSCTGRCEGTKKCNSSWQEVLP